NAGGTAWENASYWSCNQLPDENTDVLVNSGTLVLSSSVAIKSITIEPGASFTVSGTGKLQVTGAIINNGGTVDATAGTIEFNGTSAQNISGSVFVNNTVKSIGISNNVTIDNTVADTLKVSDSV